MSDEELQKYVEELSVQYFHQPFLHKAYFNNRLRTTGGRYLLRSHNIELNHKSFERFGLEELRGIILHELCHYHLHIRGMGYQHRDEDFRRLLKRVGAPRFCSTIEENKINRRERIYECVDCLQTYIRKRKVDVTKYRCGKCRGKLKEVINIE